MLRKLVSNRQMPSRRYSYASHVFIGSGSDVSVSTPDPSRAYLVIYVNFCTASGNTTTTDSVTPDVPVLKINGSVQTDIWRNSYTDNTGDEGTGNYISIYSIPAGTASFTVNCQGAEDYYGTAIYMLYDDGPLAENHLANPTEYPDSSGRGTASPIAITPHVTNSKVAQWLVSASNMDSLASSTGKNSYSATLDYLPRWSSVAFVFYHGYGASAPASVDTIIDPTAKSVTLTTQFSLARQGNTTNVESTTYSGIYSLDKVPANGSNAGITLNADTSYAQGDSFIVLFI